MMKNIVLKILLILVIGFPTVAVAQIGTHNLIRAEEFRKQSDWDNAIVYYTKSIEADEANGDVFLTAISYGHRAQAYFNKENFDQTILDCNKALEFKVDIGWVYHLRGSSLSRKSRTDEALADFTHAIQLNPTFPESYTSRGSVYSRKGSSELAIADYGRAIELEPANTSGYILRGTEFRKKGYLNESIMDFDIAVKLDPKLVDAYIGRGLTNSHKRDYDMAITDFNKALELNPNSFDAYFFRGNTNVDKGNYDNAISDYGEVIRLKPDHQFAYANRGDIYVKKGEYRRAIEDYNKKIVLEPKNINVRYARAWANLYSNDGMAAYVDSSRYLELSGLQTENAGYAVLVGYLGLRKTNKVAESKTFLVTPIKRIEGDEWVKNIIGFVKGNLTADQLLDLAIDNDKLTEAHAYIGEIQLLGGDDIGARSHFNWVKSTGNKSFSEYILAIAELNRLADKKR